MKNFIKTIKSRFFMCKAFAGESVSPVQKRAALILSGCGVYDGSEIHEAVCALLNLKKRGALVEFFAPEIDCDVVNHLTGEAESAKRNVLVESARIARGQIQPITKFDASRFDVMIFAGGFGAAKNLSSFAFDGASCSVQADVASAIKSALENKVRMGFLCISPVVAARVISSGVKLTIGNAPDVAAAINQMGATHIECSSDSFVKDSDFLVWSTPAYMLASDIAELDVGISKMIEDILK